jgi:hypothetical protein
VAVLRDANTGVQQRRTGRHRIEPIGFKYSCIENWIEAR